MVQTLEQLLQRSSDEELANIYTEIASTVVPETGYAVAFCKKINRLIDKGEMCINPTTYRKVYLPTLVKAINRELASRYVESLQ